MALEHAVAQLLNKSFTVNNYPRRLAGVNRLSLRILSQNAHSSAYLLVCACAMDLFLEYLVLNLEHGMYKRLAGC